jgi:hypothetical protein
MTTKKQLWKKIPGTRLLRDGAYEAILVVPPDCRPALGGKKSLTRRLGKGYSEAVKRSRVVLAEFHEQIDAARLSRKTTGGDDILDPQEAVKAIETWRMRELQRIEYRVFNEAPPSSYEIVDGAFPVQTPFENRRLKLHEALSRTSRYSPFGRTPPGYLDIPEFDQKLIAALAEGGVAVAADHPGLGPLRPVFQSAWYNTVCYEDGLINGSARLGAPRQVAVGGAPKQAEILSSSTPIATFESPSLFGVFEQWKQEHLRSGRVNKTADEFETQILRFIDVIGDKPVAEVSKKDVILFKDRMMQYPARTPTAVAEAGVEAAIGWGEENEAPLLKAKTLNEKVLAAVRAVLSYARDRGDIDANPAEHVRVKAGEEPKPKLPYTVQDLRALFACPVFSSGDRPIGGAGEAAKWLPLLALFTGARLEELACLEATDIKNANGIEFIHFQRCSDDGHMRHLKNRYAPRKVPIHSVLLRLGFLDFVAAGREIAERRLFPRLTSAREKQSAAFSKWYSRYSRQFVPDDKKSFHSFRHTVKRELRTARIEKALRDAVMGHAHTDEAERYGLDEDGQGFELTALRDAVEAIRYDGLDLSAVR